MALNMTAASEAPVIEQLRQRIGELEVSEVEFREAVSALRDGEGRLYQILESTPVPTLVIDRDHVVTHWNRACVNLTGFPAERMIGTRDQWRPFYPQRRAILADAIIEDRTEAELTGLYGDQWRRMAMMAEAYEAEGFFPGLGADGKWLYFTAAPLTDAGGARVGAIETIHDITERKRAEREINALNRRLEQSVTELKASIEMLHQTRNQLVESEKMAMLGRLVGGVAHEINTPVGVAVTAASLLVEKTTECGTLLSGGGLKRSDLGRYLKTAGDSAEIILANLRRAAEFIQSFKQVAVDQVSEEPRRFGLRDYILDMLASLRPRLKKTAHAVEVDVPEGIEMKSFPGAISQIISNLVINSLIHGFDGIDKGHIRMEAQIEGADLVFRYQDDGRGMGEEQVERVFEPFYTTRRGRGGDGLGMHIVYNLVTQKLKGTIACESRPEHGARFTIRMPVSEGGIEES